MKKYSDVNDAISAFLSKNIHSGSPILSAGAFETLFDSFEELQNEDCDAETFNSAALELVENAYKIDECSPEYPTLTVKSITNVITAQEGILIEDRDQNTMYYGSPSDIPKNLLNRLIVTVSGNDFERIRLTVA